MPRAGEAAALVVPHSRRGQKTLLEQDDNVTSKHAIAINKPKREDSSGGGKPLFVHVHMKVHRDTSGAQIRLE